jgi:predicted outer membrane repeat protein
VFLVGNTGKQGAALDIAANTSVVMEGCLVDQTNASATGSAVYAAEGSRLQVLDTEVRLTNGTGVYFLGDELVVKNSRFLNNTARSRNAICHKPGATQGGGIFASAVRAGSRQLRANITNSTFIGNTACSGGAVAVAQATQLFLRHSRFTNNEAWKGAAVMGLQGSCLVNITDTVFAGEMHSSCQHLP